jgi:hypothetical protein
MRMQMDNDLKEEAVGKDSVSLTVFGATTCEDTALVRSRLRFAGVPFDELDACQHRKCSPAGQAGPPRRVASADGSLDTERMAVG